jgi:amino acid transporter
MAQQADERMMISERIAPGMLPRVLNTTDMTIIFLAIVLFIVQASVIQPAGPSAYVYWILGFLLFLIPGAIITAQLGQMFPQEGSLYVWTQKALGPFWGFFAGFCAWWPGVLVMVATADLVVTIWQFIRPGDLAKSWQQMIVILAVLWFSAFMSLFRLRITQTYANLVVFFYGAAIFVIGLAGVLWLIGGNDSANSFSGVHNWLPDHTNWTFFGLVILALLGIEVPLNFGVEITDIRAIKKYLLWGSLAVMAAYLWATFGNMVTVPVKDNNSTTGILTAVQHGFWGSHTFAVIVALVVMWFFVSNTVVYNYSFSRLLFVSGLERRLPAALGKVDARKVPRNAVLAQTVIASIFAVVTFGPWAQNGNFPAQVYLVFQAAVTVIWCLSMVLLFSDVFLVKRAFPQKFEEVKVASTPVLYLCGLIGVAASIIGAIVTFKDPWNGEIFTVSAWREWLAIVGGVSVLAAVVIYAISEYVHRREAPTPTMTPAA